MLSIPSNIKQKFSVENCACVYRDYRTIRGIRISPIQLTMRSKSHNIQHWTLIHTHDCDMVDIRYAVVMVDGGSKEKSFQCQKRVRASYSIVFIRNGLFFRFVKRMPTVECCYRRISAINMGYDVIWKRKQVTMPYGSQLTTVEWHAIYSSAFSMRYRFVLNGFGWYATGVICSLINSDWILFDRWCT